MSDESENEFENIKTVEKVLFYNKGNKNDQKKNKRENTRGIRWVHMKYLGRVNSVRNTMFKMAYIFEI